MNPLMSAAKNLRNLSTIPKAMLVVLVSVIGYLFLFLTAGMLFVPEQPSMAEMMSAMMGTNPAVFSTTSSTTVNLVSLVFAVLFGFVAAVYLFRTEQEHREYRILSKALSEDEKKIMDEIKNAGEITQDSLRFRLDWSKAKVSTILTNLDKRGLILREKTGKTYKVYRQKISV